MGGSSKAEDAAIRMWIQPITLAREAERCAVSLMGLLSSGVDILRSAPAVLSKPSEVQTQRWLHSTRSDYVIKAPKHEETKEEERPRSMTSGRDEEMQRRLRNSMLGIMETSGSSDVSPTKGSGFASNTRHFHRFQLWFNLLRNSVERNISLTPDVTAGAVMMLGLDGLES